MDGFIWLQLPGLDIQNQQNLNKQEDALTPCPVQVPMIPVNPYLAAQTMPTKQLQTNKLYMYRLINYLQIMQTILFILKV